VTAGPIDKKVGDTLRLPVLIRDDDGVPIDLTGYTVACEIRSAADRSLAATMAVTLGNQVTAPGTLELLVSDTSALDAGRYVVDLRYVDVPGDSVSTETWTLVLGDPVTPRSA